MRPTAIKAPDRWPTPGSHARFVEIDVRALTPIYKGGSGTVQIDEDRPFRVPSIRGVLRYWWRATSPFVEVAQLRDRERVVFGGVHGDAARASSVSVAVLEQRSTAGTRPLRPYAFGVAGNVPEGDAGKRQVHLGATGRVRVEWRDHEVADDVRRALRAWLLFGGIGGRSRRGAGSVWWSPTSSLGVPPDSVEALVSAWRGLAPTSTKQPLWPTLARGALLVGPPGSPDQAWAAGLDGMRDVRASRDVRPAFIPKRGEDLQEWKRKDYVEIAAGRRFVSPRAALGLPIRFQGSAGTFSLTPAGHNRFPSPIHLKVVQLGVMYHPVFVVLRGPMPSELQAKHAGGTLDPTGVNRFLQLAEQLPGWKRFELEGSR